MCVVVAPVQKGGKRRAVDLARGVGGGVGEPHDGARDQGRREGQHGDAEPAAAAVPVRAVVGLVRHGREAHGGQQIRRRRRGTPGRCVFGRWGCRSAACTSEPLHRRDMLAK